MSRGETLSIEVMVVHYYRKYSVVTPYFRVRCKIVSSQIAHMSFWSNEMNLKELIIIKTFVNVNKPVTEKL